MGRVTADIRLIGDRPSGTTRRPTFLAALNTRTLPASRLRDALMAFTVTGRYRQGPMACAR